MIGGRPVLRGRPSSGSSCSSTSPACASSSISEDTVARDSPVRRASSARLVARSRYSVSMMRRRLSCRRLSEPGSTVMGPCRRRVGVTPRLYACNCGYLRPACALWLLSYASQPQKWHGVVDFGPAVVEKSDPMYLHVSGLQSPYSDGD